MFGCMDRKECNAVVPEQNEKMTEKLISRLLAKMCLALIKADLGAVPVGTIHSPIHSFSPRTDSVRPVITGTRIQFTHGGVRH